MHSVGAGLCSARASDQISNSGRSRAPPLQSAEQIKIISPQKVQPDKFRLHLLLIADILRQLAANLMPTVSGGAYQDAREVSLVWNDA